MQYGFNPKSTVGRDGANGDPDKDNQTNLQEYKAGTNPLVANAIRLFLPVTTR